MVGGNRRQADRRFGREALKGRTVIRPAESTRPETRSSRPLRERHVHRELGRFQLETEATESVCRTIERSRDRPIGCKDWPAAHCAPVDERMPLLPVRRPSRALDSRVVSARVGPRAVPCHDSPPRAIRPHSAKEACESPIRCARPPLRSPRTGERILRVSVIGNDDSPIPLDAL